MSVVFNNDIPIYMQIVTIIKNDIISGKYQIGDKLPSVRDLAITMKVNPNTVQKALIELEELKLVYTERTNGKYVTNDKKIIDLYKKKYSKEITNKYVLNMQEIGFNIDEIKNIIGGIK